MSKNIVMIKQGLTILTMLIIVCFLYSCEDNPTKKDSLQEVNPPAKGFNIKASDQKAIDLADQSMIAMGGRKAYDETRYLSWNFFGSRMHVWDKVTGDIFIDNLRDKYQLKMNINDNTGTMIRDGKNIVNKDSLEKYLQRGKEMWINDAYWLVMPYKLKDSGVTLKYVGQDTTSDGRAAEKLELTFANVGVTPENKYHVYVDNVSKLVTQWDFFNDYKDTEARFSTPWADYKKYGKIKLSGNRGKNSLTEISTSEELKDFFNTN